MIAEKTVVYRLCLYNCMIGNNLPKYLSNNLKFDLVQVSIKSDPISNKGMELLVKIHFKRLACIYLCNINVTNDGLKLLNKINTRM